jgi:protein-L-isoaspartate O-methyltransferase
MQITDFTQKILDSIQQETFVKITLSKPTAETTAKQLRNIYARLVTIKGKPMLSCNHRYTTRDEVKNHHTTDLPTLLNNWLPDQWSAANLFTTTGETTILISKKGEINTIVGKNTNTQQPTLSLGLPFSKTTNDQLPTTPNQQPTTHDHIKKRYIHANAPYLNALEIATPEGEITKTGQKKYKQINKYIEIIDALIREHPLTPDMYITDMGSGKGYLTFALYDYLVNTGNQPNITGIELRENLVTFCTKLAQKCDYPNLIFKAEDIATFTPKRIDMLIALHACDTATDLAIAKGIKSGAEIIVVAPCCHKQIRREIETGIKNVNQALQPILQHGILLERQAESVTDAIRALILEANGYKTKVFEFISSEHTAKNVMITATKTKNKTKDTQTQKVKISKAQNQITQLKAQFGINTHFLETLI